MNWNLLGSHPSTRYDHLQPQGSVWMHQTSSIVYRPQNFVQEIPVSIQSPRLISSAGSIRFNIRNQTEQCRRKKSQQPTVDYLYRSILGTVSCPHLQRPCS